MKEKIILILFFLGIFNNNLLIQNTFAEVPTVSTPPASVTGAAGGTTEAPAGMDKIKELLNSPLGVIIVAGIGTVYSGILYKDADKQEKESNANIAKIDKMIATFKDSYAGYCTTHNDLTNAKCYCYNTDGSKNTSRTNSQTCIDLWAKGDYVLAGDAANYNALPYSADVAGCVTVDGQFDETCKCKKLVDSSGKNACQKESSITLSQDSLSTGLATAGVSSLLKYTANATNGNPQLSTLNASSLSTNAIKARQITDAIISKIPGNANSIPKITESNVGKYAKAALGERAIANNMKSNNMTSNIASARSDNPTTNALLKAAQAKVGIDVNGSGKGLSAAKDKKKPGFDLNLGSEGGGSGGGQVISNFPEDKNYKFKNSDIVTDNSASIFEIISNRYVQSGLKRLFDDDAK